MYCTYTFFVCELTLSSNCSGKWWLPQRGSLRKFISYEVVTFSNRITYPIGSMYGIYSNIGGILMGSMLPYILAPWILWVFKEDTSTSTIIFVQKKRLRISKVFS